MALTFCDGFDSYAATSDLSKKWASAGTGWAWGAAFGRNGGGGGQASGAATALQTGAGTFVSNAVYVAIGFWLKVSTTPAALGEIIRPLTSANATCATLRIDTSGFLRMYNATGSVLLIGAKNVCDNIWHWVEWKMQCNATAVQTLYVDGSVEWSSSQASGTPIADHFYVANPANVTMSIDDIIVYDNIGSSPLAGTDYPLGPREITTLRPNADGTVQFSRSSGSTNYSLVNETNADDDTSYVEDGVSGEQDLYDFANLSFTPANINAVMLNSYLENPNPGTINHKQICKSNATQTDGASVITPAAYAVRQQVFSVDPNTSAAWGATGLNAAKFGIKVV